MFHKSKNYTADVDLAGQFPRGIMGKSEPMELATLATHEIITRNISFIESKTQSLTCTPVIVNLCVIVFSKLCNLKLDADNVAVLHEFRDKCAIKT